jgi:hypothetical protein
MDGARHTLEEEDEEGEDSAGAAWGPAGADCGHEQDWLELSAAAWGGAELFEGEP